MTVDCGRPLASLRNDNPKSSRAVLQRTPPYDVDRCAFGGDPRTFALLYCPVFKELQRPVIRTRRILRTVVAYLRAGATQDIVSRGDLRRQPARRVYFRLRLDRADGNLVARPPRTEGPTVAPPAVRPIRRPCRGHASALSFRIAPGSHRRPAPGDSARAPRDDSRAHCNATPASRDGSRGRRLGRIRYMTDP